MQMISVTFPFVLEKNLEHCRFVDETFALVGGKEEFAEVCMIDEPLMREIGYSIPVRLNDEEMQSLASALSPVLGDVSVNQWERRDDDEE